MAAAIVDTETGERWLAAHEEGELLLAAPQLMKGYWRNTDETAAALRRHADGRVWLHTGDIGYMDEDGYVFLTDRKKDLIKTSGYQVWPREVEEILYRCPGVREAAIVGLPDERWGSAVTAFIVRSDPALAAADIDAFCRESDALAAYKRPRRVIFVDSLPTNPSGKVLKRELIARMAKEG